MMQLFKEVTSPKGVEKMEAEKLTEGAGEQNTKGPESAEKETVKKGKHGDPGVCCGGCS